MSTQLRPTGIPALGDLPRGMHVCLFYETPSDLLDAVVPFFAAGLPPEGDLRWAMGLPSVDPMLV